MKPAVVLLALLASCAAPRRSSPAGGPSDARSVASTSAPATAARAPARSIPVSPIEEADLDGQVGGVILQVVPAELKWQASGTATLAVRLTNQAVDCLWVDTRMLLCDDRRCELRPWLFDPAGKRAGALYWVQVQPPSREDYRTIQRGESVEATAELTFRDYDFRMPGRYTLQLAYQDPVVPPLAPPPGCVPLEGKAVSNPIAIDR